MVKDLCFEVIEKCLNNCMFCSSNSDCNKNRIIKFKDFQRVIDYFISTGGIQELSISGGEPFLHPDLFKMVEYAKSKGIRTVIFTSGVVQKVITDEYRSIINIEMQDKIKLIDEIEPDDIISKNKIKRTYDNALSGKFDNIRTDDFLYLKKLGLDKIVFDYQGYNYETDHMLMGRTDEARFALIRSIACASKVGLDIDIHFVPMKPNYKEIGDILEMLEIAEVKNISLLNFLPQGRGRQNEEALQLSNEEFYEFLEILDKYKNYYTGKVRIGIPLQGENSHKCNAGIEKLDIKFDGTVLPCPAFKEITVEECRRFNIKLPNIYTNLEDVKISGHGTRVVPLCKQIYEARK